MKNHVFALASAVVVGVGVAPGVEGGTVCAVWVGAVEVVVEGGG